MKKIKLNEVYPNINPWRKVDLGKIDVGQEIDTGIKVTGIFIARFFSYDVLMQIYTEPMRYSSIIKDDRNLASLNPDDPKYCFFLKEKYGNLFIKNNYHIAQNVTIYYKV